MIQTRLALLGPTVCSALACGEGNSTPGDGGSGGRGGGKNGSGSINGTGGSSSTGGNTSVPVNACTQAGGACVEVIPGSCASGTMNSSLSCGPGVGSACCMPGGTGGGSGGGGSIGRGGSSGAGGMSGTGGVAGHGGSVTGGTSGAAGQGGRATGGSTGSGGTSGPEAAACGQAGGLCIEQGGCVKQGGTVAATSPAGCHFDDGPAECCVAPAPKPNPAVCADDGGVCTSITGCTMAAGYFATSNYECSFPGDCCVPYAACGDKTIDCCGDDVRFNAACEGGKFVCVVGSPVPLGTCKTSI